MKNTHVQFYEGDDCYEDFIQRAGTVVDGFGFLNPKTLNVVLSLKKEGLSMDDGRHLKVDIKLGGDMKMVNAI